MKPILYLLFISTMCFSYVEAAEPDVKIHLEVVADAGGESALPYYVAISADKIPENQGYVPSLNTPVSVSLQQSLPITPAFLSVGRVTSRKLSLPNVMTPFFIIGADPVSAAWLQNKATELRRINAVGLVTQVNSISELKTLSSLAQGLELQPVNADDIARTFSFQHYPVLITYNLLSQ